MPDTQLQSKWDLRQPGQKDELAKAVKGCFRSKRKGAQFGCREIAEYVGASMQQTRVTLNALLAEGYLAYEGVTRNTVYFAV